MKFKPGDKVYCYSNGVVELTASLNPQYQYPLKITAGNDTSIITQCYRRYFADAFLFTECGRRYFADKYPSLITLEEAEKRGFVRKKVTAGEKLRVKYFHDHIKRYQISSKYYSSEIDFNLQSEFDWGFVSFVDEKLNECDPPKKTIEWGEI
jgi:hypothetical protein